MIHNEKLGQRDQAKSRYGENPPSDACLTPEFLLLFKGFPNRTDKLITAPRYRRDVPYSFDLSPNSLQSVEMF